MDAQPQLESFVRYCADSEALATFWASLFRVDVARSRDGWPTVFPDPDASFPLAFQPAPDGIQPLDPRRQRAHPDLTSASAQAQQDAVERAQQAGAVPVDVGQLPEETHVVLADPEGAPWCVIEPGNNFLAGTGALGAFACDGTHAVGEFWANALGWPLVWDEGDETAIQSPAGGAKITWGGPPVVAKKGPNPWHPHLRVPDAAATAEHAARLVALGASVDASGHAGTGGLAMLDPDGNEFCLLPALGTARDDSARGGEPHAARVRLSGRLLCADSEQAQAVRDFLVEHVRATRAEAGCLSFEVTVSADPLAWDVEEWFADRTAFDLHQARVAASPWGAATAGITREYTVEESA
ncbi:VOC family protein [Galactobacter caseinivorans]|nr:VOC family protein [Galactobacter caseinivorans]